LKFDFSPIPYLPPDGPEDSLYERMVAIGFDEATQRMGKAFFREHLPERRYALVRREGSAGTASGAVTPTLRQSVARSSATAFCISPLGYFVTAQHFTGHAKRFKLQGPNGLLEAELVREDAANDLAILKVKGSFGGTVPIRPSKGVRLGESVATLGFPQTTLQGVEPKVTRGEISSLSGARDDPRQFQISVPVQPGNSGGPLVDMNGQIVGVIRAQLQGGQSVNYAVKSSLLLSLLESIPELANLPPAVVPAAPPKFEDMLDRLRPAVALVYGYDAAE
jgi:S1-C subfamily serine protease